MHFRKATKKDISDVVKMLADDDLGAKREKYSNPLPQTYLDAFDAIDSDPNQELIVVENDDQEILGTFQLSFLQYLTYQGGVRAQIEAVRIRKDQRGKGIGKQMFEWAINRAQQKGAHVLQLTSNKERLKAILFYKNLGFVDSHEGMKLHL
ncbi:GNAT family N-acetyltransferase [Aquimarina sp. D1M17]|uniref:GNAT family N-acetyltransferase n=1 Tax=Aquimarina acroporae TaxID=2937283 RepID=UPI0020C04522|nr:GNAT family N-acetyltransferase [Aquimarina acroporae]MCK8522848.1 GNAT family N-acetyltransferase [Aquimarina acroporae]